jgi:hypothetical protein
MFSRATRSRRRAGDLELGSVIAVEWPQRKVLSRGGQMVGSLLAWRVVSTKVDQGDFAAMLRAPLVQNELEET